MKREDLLRAAVRRITGAAPDKMRLRPGAGGSINRGAVLELPACTLFVKWNERPLPDQFAAEAAGLTALRKSNAGLIIPQPLAWDDSGPGRSFLLMEYLEPGAPVEAFPRLLGEGLARLHGTTTPRGFGFERDGYCGATPQPNGWMTDWLEFYRQRRLGHQLLLARQRGLGRWDVARMERLLERLGEWIRADEPPALLHGDLWSGNLHVTAGGRPALLDPAAYFGHPEAELAMMRLFGGFSPAVFEAYTAVHPLSEGAAEREDLYALYHLLNHFNLFGGGYGARAMAIVRHYVG